MRYFWSELKAHFTTETLSQAGYLFSLTLAYLAILKKLPVLLVKNLHFKTFFLKKKKKVLLTESMAALNFSLLCHTVSTEVEVTESQSG